MLVTSHIIVDIDQLPVLKVEPAFEEEFFVRELRQEHHGQLLDWTLENGDVVTFVRVLIVL